MTNIDNIELQGTYTHKTLTRYNDKSLTEAAIHTDRYSDEKY